MNICVFGLGYVGCVSISCLFKNGHHVIGIDVNESKVELINSGKSPIIEKDVDSLIMEGWKEGKINATSDYNYAIKNSDVAFICVGTPSLQTGQLDLQYVLETAHQIGESIKSKTSFYVIAIRSTVFPGTNFKVEKIIESVSGKKPGTDFSVISNPEFLREGSAVEDYFYPAMTVVGSDNDKAINIIRDIYKQVNAPFIITEIKVAEIIKYVNNAYHALKISFANEIGNVCKKMEIDSFAVMELFKMDNRLNISTAYFKPGMAYGGSCLPKDLKGLSTISHDNYLRTPVLNSIEESNSIQLEIPMKIIEKYGEKEIGILGLAFKKGTDDLRHSPIVDLIEKLIGKGYKVKVYDRNVNLSFLVGSNKSYVNERLPHISELMVDNIQEMLKQSKILVIGHAPERDELMKILLFRSIIVDLVNVDELRKGSFIYEGISW